MCTEIYILLHTFCFRGTLLLQSEMDNCSLYVFINSHGGKINPFFHSFHHWSVTIETGVCRNFTNSRHCRYHYTQVPLYLPSTSFANRVYLCTTILSA